MAKPEAPAPDKREAQRIREAANTWNGFLQARYQDAAFATPLTGTAAVELARANRMLGYAHGCIDALLDEGRPDLAIAKLGWMVNEGLKFGNHRDYPGNARAQA